MAFSLPFFKKKPDPEEQSANPPPAPATPSAPPPFEAAQPPLAQPTGIPPLTPRKGNLAEALKAASGISSSGGGSQSAIFKPKVSVILNVEKPSEPSSSPLSPSEAPAQTPAEAQSSSLDLSGFIEIPIAEILPLIPENLLKSGAQESGLIPAHVTLPIASIYPQLAKGKVQFPLPDLLTSFNPEALEPAVPHGPDILIKIPLHLIIPLLPDDIISTPSNQARQQVDPNIEAPFPENNPGSTMLQSKKPEGLDIPPPAPKPEQIPPQQPPPAPKDPSPSASTARPPLKVPKISAPILRPLATASTVGEQTMLVRPIGKGGTSTARPPTLTPISNVPAAPPANAPVPAPRPSNLQAEAGPAISPPTILVPPAPIISSVPSATIDSSQTAPEFTQPVIVPKSLFKAPTPVPSTPEAAKTEAKPAEGSPDSGTLKLFQLIGINDNKEMRIQEIIEQLRAHFHLVSAMIATQDGLPLAGSMPSEMDSNAWSSIGTILFRSFSGNQTPPLGSPRRCMLNIGDLWITLLHENGIYLILTHKTENITRQFEEQNTLLIHEVSQYCQRQGGKT